MGRDDFVKGDCNRDSLAAVVAWPDWPQVPTLLVGPEGSGKSHLVGIWSALSGATIVQAVNLTEADCSPGAPRGPIAVEDVERAPEKALFHLLNRAREYDAPVLLTTRDERIVETIGLADLGSRLRAARPLRIMRPDDVFLLKVLAKLFSDRQLPISPQLLEYLVRRMERTYAAAAELVSRMDEMALSKGMALSRQLAAAALLQFEQHRAGMR
jgi:chromosomal replication initiation ATPase DnaA